MKIALLKNGAFQLILTPEDEFEELVLKRMSESAAKGKRVELGVQGKESYVVSVEAK